MMGYQEKKAGHVMVSRQKSRNLLLRIEIILDYSFVVKPYICLKRRYRINWKRSVKFTKKKKHLQDLLQPDTDLVCSSASEPILLGLQRQSVKYMDPGRVIWA